jgi:hypothetical protein
MDLYFAMSYGILQKYNMFLNSIFTIFSIIFLYRLLPSSLLPLKSTTLNLILGLLAIYIFLSSCTSLFFMIF